MTFIYFAIVLGVTVFIHELGHFIFAKKAGVYIYEFAIGMGPRLFKFKRKNDETVYSIRLFPIGGFVQMAGEAVDEDEKIPTNQRLYAKTWTQRLLTIIAGIMFNFISAIIILFVLALFNGSTSLTPKIGELNENALNAGLKENDIVLKINNHKTNNIDKLLLEMQLNTGKELTIVVKRNNKQETINLKPVEIKEDDNTRYSYGFSLKAQTERGFLASIKYAFSKFISLIEQMIFVIFYLVTGQLSLSNLSGPVGIFQIVGESAKAGIVNLIYLIAYLSINVGFVNLLPIPAFDGGRLLFLIIEKIKGSPVNSKTENIIHAVGFGLLMLLMVVITFNDITRLF